jgi:multidrug efflux pump subunit AcrB
LRDFSDRKTGASEPDVSLRKATAYGSFPDTAQVVEATLALMLFRLDRTILSLIGIILMIGFAMDAEHREGKTSPYAIYEACLLRLRPFTMTSMTALLGSLPLALGTVAYPPISMKSRFSRQ